MIDQVFESNRVCILRANSGPDLARRLLRRAVKRVGRLVVICDSQTRRTYMRMLGRPSRQLPVRTISLRMGTCTVTFALARADVDLAAAEMILAPLAAFCQSRAPACVDDLACRVVLFAPGRPAILAADTWALLERVKFN